MRIEFHKVFPGWISSSFLGAYSPYYNTIYIRKGLGLITTIWVVLHEFGHWAIFKLKLNPKFHGLWDRKGWRDSKHES